MPEREPPPYLNGLMRNGMRMQSKTELYAKQHKGELKGTVAHVPCGQLAVQTGNLLASDPTVLTRTAPLARLVDPGAYPVSLAVVTFGAVDDSRVGAMIMRLKDGTPSRWVADDSSQLAVESGMVALLDGFNPAPNKYKATLGKIITQGFAANAKQTWSWMGWTAAPNAEPGTPCDMIACSSGFGNGAYQAWWGLAGKDEPVCLLIDFAVFG